MAEDAATETTKITQAEEGTTARTGGSQNPPAYDSIFGRLQSVKKDSKGPKDIVAKSCNILCASVLGTIVLAPVLAVPIAMIAVGAIHLDDCPVERFIPIYLLVGGCFGALQIILTLILRVKNHLQENNKPKDSGRQAGEEGEEDGKGGGGKKGTYKDTNASLHPCSGLISCFLFAWFIAGNVWVYRAFSTVTTSDVASPLYCNGSVYWFAFVLITSGYACIALSCCCVALCGIILCIWAKD